MKKLKWIFMVMMLLVGAVAMAQEDTLDVLPGEDLPEAATFRAVPDSIIANLKRDKDFAYANDPAYWEQERRKKEQEFSPSWLDKLASQLWFKRVLMALLACLLIYAVVKIALSNRMMMRRKPKQFHVAEDDVALQKENLDKLVLQAEQDANFRLAVRYRYMKALQQMEARGIIQQDAKSTNWDYVNRLNNHPLKKQFLLLTRAYEYVWYGEFALNGEQYQYLKTEFEHYNNSLA